MAETLTMHLPAGVRQPTDAEIRAAKDYVLRRSEAARLAREQAADLIAAAAQSLVEIAYRYAFPVSQFIFDSSLSEDMMDEVAGVMNDLEEELYALLEEYAMQPVEEKDRRALLALLLTLGHRNMSLRETLQAYEWRLLRQVEAYVAAMRYADVPQTQAIGKVRNALGSWPSANELQAAFHHKHDFAAPFIKSGGIVFYPDGSRNVQGVPVDGENAIMTVINNSVAYLWSRAQLQEMQEDGQCVGYWQDRGSTFDCPVCDSEVGFHPLGDIDDDPYPHLGCMCWRVPVYSE